MGDSSAACFLKRRSSSLAASALTCKYKQGGQTTEAHVTMTVQQATCYYIVDLSMRDDPSNLTTIQDVSVGKGVFC